MVGKELKVQNDFKYISLDSNLFILNFYQKRVERLSELLGFFPKKKIIVIGDIMLDKTLIGEVSRISPEAPIQVVNVKEEFYEPGGAANVAANIASLGGNVSLFGFVGEDNNAEILSEILLKQGIKYFFDKNSTTTLKARIKGRNQQLLRLDYEESSPKNFSSESKTVLKQEIDNSDLVLIADYAKGVITTDLMNFLKSSGKRIIIDPKPQNMPLYSDSFLITPNEKEAVEMSSQKDIQDAGRWLREKLRCNVLVTRGERGMTLFSEKEMDIPTYAKEVYDVTGAGDTANAAISLCLASGASLEEAAVIANHAAGIAVGKSGTYQVKLGELEKRIFGEEKKLKSFEELSSIVEDLKKKQKRVVWTNGCFDILTSGHTKYLAKAKEQGDCLIVGLNSDSSVRSIKDPSRPINSENTRAEVLSSLSCVDYVIIYSEPHPTRYISLLKPNIYAKGGDYNIDTINQDERKIVEGYGGRIAILNVGEDISTSKIIDRIRGPKNDK